MGDKSELKWFVASVCSCQERKVVERLTSMGIETYVPIQKVSRRWSDRVKIVDKLLLPGLVFVFSDEATRKATLDTVYGISYYFMDRTSAQRKLLTVPQQQMDDFRRVVSALNGEGDLSVSDQHISKGDTVRVIHGPLEGFVSECVEIQSQHKLVIRLGSLGSILVKISASDVVKV